jgi:hypothetical protein
MGEQAGVVRLREGLSVDAELVGEPHGDQGAVQPVLEGEPHAEVRGQAQGGDQLGASDLLAALRDSGRHYSARGMWRLSRWRGIPSPGIGSQGAA